jgi:hypothetical protein
MERLPQNISWVKIQRGSAISYKEVREMAEQFASDVALNEKLFEEVGQVNEILQNLPDPDNIENDCEEMWKKLFADSAFPCLYQLVSFVFSIPVANAECERLFPFCSAQWRKGRNSLNVSTVQALLQVQVNFGMKCSEFYHFLMQNLSLLREIRFDEKY